MRLPLIVVAACLSTAALAEPADVRSRIEAATLYPDGATVTRLVTARLSKGDNRLVLDDLPVSLDPASLRVEGSGAQAVSIAGVDVVPPPRRPVARPAESEKKLEALHDARALIEARMAAQQARQKFIERFAQEVPLGVGEKGDARPMADWRGAFASVEEDMGAVLRTLDAARIELREVDRSIAQIEAELQKQPARKLEARIDLAAEEAGTVSLRVSYNIRAARWVPAYDARLDSGDKDRKPQLELVRRADIVQSSGEDWRDVELTVSTTRSSGGAAAAQLEPWIVRFEPPRPAPMVKAVAPRMMDDKAAMAESVMAGRVADESRREAVEREAVAEPAGFSAQWKVPGKVSVASGDGGRKLRLTSEKVMPELMVRSVPSVATNAFLEGSFPLGGEMPMAPGKVSVYRDGLFVGTTQLAQTAPGETIHLGFGVDERVSVALAPLKRAESSGGIFSGARVEERSARITVRNGHERAMKIVVEDRVPVSEVQEITVESLPGTTAPSQQNVRDRRGVSAWAFELPAGGTKEIVTGFRVKWPADKPIVLDGQRW